MSVLLTIQKSFEPSKDGGRRGIQYERCILCDVCSDTSEQKHIQNLGDFHAEKLTCSKTGTYMSMDVTRYKRLFEGKRSRSEAGPSSNAESKRSRSEAGSSSNPESKQSRSEAGSSSNAENIPDPNFELIKVNCSEWYDHRSLLNKLKLLYKDLLPTGVLDEASNTTELLNSLMDREHLTSHDLTLFYETIKVTEQFGLARKIKEKIGAFPNVRDIVISKLTPHRLMLVEFGDSLTNKDMQKMNTHFNEAKQNYEDKWHLIMDLEEKNKICEEDMQPFIDSIKLLQLIRPVQVLKGKRSRSKAGPSSNAEKLSAPGLQ
ncbi:uncharacterized protein [Antedon mediterranea]|uniref:uncharacterized protein n=1 Tax=Antedon mediterranea TaxID=105859 RepID=UPI003AF96DDF